MSIRKYIFTINSEGLKTYKVISENKYELRKPNGMDYFPETNINKFFQWFHRDAAITDGEYTDFCFLSETKLDNLSLLKYNSSCSSASSWNKQEICDFCEKYLSLDSYKILYDKDKCFIVQNTNVPDESKIKTLYLKCLPKFSLEIDEKKIPNNNGSILWRFYNDKLQKIMNKDSKKINNNR